MTAKAESNSKPGFFSGFAGTIDGHYFGVLPKWVDASKKPGYTSMEEAGVVPKSFTEIKVLKRLLPLSFFWSFDVIWFTISAIMWYVLPYDLEDPAAKNFQLDFVLKRVGLWLAVGAATFVPTHIAFCAFQWCNRKIHDEEGPSKSRLAHNVHFAVLGLVQCAFIDAVVIYTYANGFVPTPASTEQVLGSPWELAKFCLGFPLVGAFREIHFFFIHIFIHIRFLYRHIHSIHHRNIAVEPFAGITMHPVEHMFYFSCVFPVLATGSHPFIALYCLVHAAISPIAGHFGAEDFSGSDVFHLLHHSKFECNYGTPSYPLDRLFGTYREKYGKSECYTGSWNDDESDEAVTKKGPVLKYLRGSLTLKGALWGTSQQALFDIVTCFGIPYILYETFQNREALNLPEYQLFDLDITSVDLVALFVGFLPAFTGFFLWALYDSRQSWRWPFHKESLSKFGFLVTLSLLFSIAPLFYGITRALSVQ